MPLLMATSTRFGLKSAVMVNPRLSRSITRSEHPQRRVVVAASVAVCRRRFRVSKLLLVGAFGLDCPDLVGALLVGHHTGPGGFTIWTRFDECPPHPAKPIAIPTTSQRLLPRIGVMIPRSTRFPRASRFGPRAAQLQLDQGDTVAPAHPELRD